MMEVGGGVQIRNCRKDEGGQIQGADLWGLSHD
jgi:hypothetical protein